MVGHLRYICVTKICKCRASQTELTHRCPVDGSNGPGQTEAKENLTLKMASRACTICTQPVLLL